MPKRGARVPTNLANYRKRDPSSKFEQYIPITLGIWQRGSSDNLGFIAHHSTQSQTCTSWDYKRRKENPEGTYENKRRRIQRPLLSAGRLKHDLALRGHRQPPLHLVRYQVNKHPGTHASSDLEGKICNENKPTVLMCMCFPSQR